MSAEEECRRMIQLLNEKTMAPPAALGLDVQPVKDTDWYLAFIELETGVQPQSELGFPVTVCWGGGTTADSACESVMRQFADGMNLAGADGRRCISVRAGSLAELEMKVAVRYG